MKRLLLIALALVLIIASPAMALRSTFQDWDYSAWENVAAGSYNPYVSLTTGNVALQLNTYYTSPVTIRNINGVPFTYAAFDLQNNGYAGFPPSTTIYLYDSGKSLIQTFGIDYSYYSSGQHRVEIKIVGGTPMLYVDGGLYATGSVLSVNPYYIGIYPTPGSYYSGQSHSIIVDNIILGEADHNVVGVIPSNGTIIRDLMNPSAMGYYQWNPSTSTWVLENSNYIYFYGDVDSTDATYTQNLQITNVQYGAVVNSTTIDSTIPYHFIPYNIANLLNTPTSLGTALPDGEYSVCFEGSAVCQKFWIISNGASVSLDKSSYVTGESAIVTSTMLPAYFDVVTYSYALVTKDVYGTTLNSQAINTATQTSTVTFDTAGVRYIEVVATKRSDSTTYIMGYASTTVYDYLQFSGIVYDGGTGAALSGAAYNFTSSSGITHAGTSGFDGNFTVTGFGSGGTLWYNFTKSGYVAYNYSFSPLSTGPKPLTITLKPVAPTGTGAMLQGVAHDDVYGSMIPSVTSVTATNGSESHTITPDATTSYYIFDDTRGGPLTAGKCYTLNAVKTGYLFVAPTNPQCVVAA